MIGNEREEGDQSDWNSSQLHFLRDWRSMMMSQSAFGAVWVLSMAMSSILQSSRQFASLPIRSGMRYLSSLASEPIVEIRASLNALPRDSDGSNASRKSRKDGWIPALLYGGEAGTEQLLKVSLIFFYLFISLSIFLSPSPCWGGVVCMFTFVSLLIM